MRIVLFEHNLKINIRVLDLLSAYNKAVIILPIYTRIINYLLCKKIERLIGIT